MDSVWDYPRPPALEPERRRVRVVHDGVTIADSTRALRVLETSHPPAIYVPPDDVATERLRRSVARATVCEWKGRATYWDLGDVRAVAWSYEAPLAKYGDLRDHLAFYPGRVACFLGEEPVAAQPGDFYGGWITADVAGPFKGPAGTAGW